MRRRDEDTSHRSAITAMRIRVQNEIAHARRPARVQRLFDALLVKSLLNSLRGNDGNRFAFIVPSREEGGRFARAMDDWFVVLHNLIYFQIKIRRRQILEKLFRCSTTELPSAFASRPESNRRPTNHVVSLAFFGEISAARVRR